MHGGKEVAMAEFQIYTDKKGEFRWRLLAANGKIIADSAEGYDKKSDCQHGIDLVKRDAPSAPVEEK
jgi:hypothetical protein